MSTRKYIVVSTRAPNKQKIFDNLLSAEDYARGMKLSLGYDFTVLPFVGSILHPTQSVFIYQKAT